MAAKTATISSPNKDAIIVWDNLTEADTAVAAKWPGGEGFIEVAGVPGGATVVIKFNTDSADTPYVIDADEAPDGLTFTNKTGIVKVDLPIGYITPTFSGGSSQDLNIKGSPKKEI